jgi:hypothetical protein
MDGGSLVRRSGVPIFALERLASGPRRSVYAEAASVGLTLLFCLLAICL